MIVHERWLLWMIMWAEVVIGSDALRVERSSISRVTSRKLPKANGKLTSAWFLQIARGMELTLDEKTLLMSSEIFRSDEQRKASWNSILLLRWILLILCFSFNFIISSALEQFWKAPTHLVLQYNLLSKAFRQTSARNWKLNLTTSLALQLRTQSQLSESSSKLISIYLQDFQFLSFLHYKKCL